jgi:ABC-2 type transport system ATP-binding protein
MNAPSPAVLESVTVRYGRLTACSEVSIAVERGSVYALLGRKGAGKSSLVRCLLGQQKPAEGRALLFGEDSWKHRARLMTRVGVVPEEPDVPPAMTAKDVSDFCRRLYPTWDGKGVQDRLDKLGVPPDLAFGRLSKGLKGDVLLAAALGHGPELLVLDDLTLGLDVAARKAFGDEILGELAGRGATVLLTAHDPAAVEAIATHVGILKEGRLVLDEDVNLVKSRFRRIRYANEITAERTAYGTELDAFDAVRVQVRGWGVDAVVSNFDDAAFERFRATTGVVDAEAAPMSLEEIFIAVVGERPAAPALGVTS